MSAEIQTAIERVTDVLIEHRAIVCVTGDPDVVAHDILDHALTVPQMSAAFVDHLNTDTLDGDSETLVCGGCDRVLVTGDPDDDRDPQAEHATHLAALIRTALLGADS